MRSSGSRVHGATQVVGTFPDGHRLSISLRTAAAHRRHCLTDEEIVEHGAAERPTRWRSHHDLKPASSAANPKPDYHGGIRMSRLQDSPPDK
jgi:hypothetical protein